MPLSIGGSTQPIIKKQQIKVNEIILLPNRKKKKKECSILAEFVKGEYPDTASGKVK